MTITTDDFIAKYGTQDALDDTSAAVANNAISLAGDLLAWTNDDDAPFVSFVFEGDFAATVDEDGFIELHAQQLNIVSTNDEEVPTTTYSGGYLGSFPLKDVATAQFKTLELYLTSVKTSAEWQFFIINRSGQSLDAGWDLHPTPKAIGPHA
jgi:hypothetical protein